MLSMTKKWGYFIYYERELNPEPELLKKFDSIEEAKQQDIKNIFNDYRIGVGQGSQGADPNEIPLLEQPNSGCWDVSVDAFYSLPKEDTNLDLVLLATYNNCSTFIVRVGSKKWKEICSIYEEDDEESEKKVPVKKGAPKTNEKLCLISPNITHTPIHIT